MILSFPTSSNQYHKYTKTYEITYQENNTNQKIKRKGVVSKTVKTFTEEKSGFMVVDIDGNLIPVQGFAPEILSGSTDGDKILFTITPGRNISLLPGFGAPALNITVSDNVYANTDANPTFGDIDNPGTTGISDNKKLFVNIVNGALGSDAYVEPSIPESHVWEMHSTSNDAKSFVYAINKVTGEVRKYDSYYTYSKSGELMFESHR